MGNPQGAELISVSGDTKGRKLAGNTQQSICLARTKHGVQSPELHKLCVTIHTQNPSPHEDEMGIRSPRLSFTMNDLIFLLSLEHVQWKERTSVHVLRSLRSGSRVRRPLRTPSGRHETRQPMLQSGRNRL